MENGISTSGYVANEMYDRINYRGAGWGSGFANDSTIQHGLQYNRQSVENQADCTREVIGLNLDRVSDQNQETRRVLAFNRIADRAVDAEFRTNDRLLALQAEMNANAREAAKCCCDLKLENCQNTAMLSAEIKAVEARGIERDRSLLQAELIALRTQVACGCTTGCSTPCPPA